MALNVRDVMAVIRQLAPPGRMYDWFTTTAKIYKLIYATAEFFKTYGFDLVDTLRNELYPPTMTNNLDKFEGALGISETLVARYGTTAQRRNAVLAKMRESGGLTKRNVQAIVGAILGYADNAALEVIECDRSGLRLKHSYARGEDVSLASGSTTDIDLSVRYDGGVVSAAGAQLELYFDTNDLSTFSVTLTGPDGTAKTWNRGWSASPLVLFAKEFAGAAIKGRWRISITQTSGSTRTLQSASALFVEGVAKDQATAGAVFHWGAYADPALVGGSGVPEDLPTAQRAVRRIRHAHHEANLILSKAAYPSVTSGLNALIPGRFVPGGS